MARQKGKAWKMERASVNRGGNRPRSNKYSGADSRQTPPRGTRQRIWVGGYTKSDGTVVNGYYRSVVQR